MQRKRTTTTTTTTVLTGGATGGSVSGTTGGGDSGTSSVGKGVPGGVVAGGGVTGIPVAGGGDSGVPTVGKGVIGAAVSGRMTPGVGARVVFLPASTKLIAANATMRMDFILTCRIDESARGLLFIRWKWLSMPMNDKNNEDVGCECSAYQGASRRDPLYDGAAQKDVVGGGCKFEFVVVVLDSNLFGSVVFNRESQYRRNWYTHLTF